MPPDAGIGNTGGRLHKGAGVTAEPPRMGVSPCPGRRCLAVVVHRRQLPIVGHCERFVPAPGSADEGGFCERCCKQVHDVSAMRESELRRFLAARAGTEVCLSYHTDAHGRLRLRPEPAPAPLHASLAVGALASLLAACAGHAVELESPEPVCRDADGYAVSCDEWVAGPTEMQSVPEASELAAREAEGCPVRPTAAGPGLAPVDADDLGVPAEGEPTEGLDPAPAAEPTSANARVDFTIDPDDGFLRGVVVISEGGFIDRDFVPTTDLWAQWRQRRAERKAARLRWRETASR